VISLGSFPAKYITHQASCSTCEPKAGSTGLGPPADLRLPQGQRPRLKDLLDEVGFMLTDHRRMPHHLKGGGAGKRRDGPNLDTPPESFEARAPRSRRVNPHEWCAASPATKMRPTRKWYFAASAGGAG
jgi:hypothetical protein